VRSDAKTTLHAPHCVLKIARPSHIGVDDFTRPIARLVYKRGGAHFPTPQTILAHCKSLPCFTDGMESDDKDTNWQHAGLAAWRCLLEANKKRREYRAELLGRVRTEQVKVRGEASPTKGKRRL